MLTPEQNAEVIDQITEIIDSVTEGATPPPAGDLLAQVAKIVETLTSGTITVKLADAATIPQFVTALTKAFAEAVLKVSIEDASKLPQLVMYSEGENPKEPISGVPAVWRDADGTTHIVGPKHPLPVRIMEVP